MRKYFFTIWAEIEAQGLEIGFKLFSAGHIIWLIAITVFTILMTRIYGSAGKEKREKIKKFFAVSILLSEVYKDTVLIIKGADMMGYLPLHLCSFAMFCMAYDAFAKVKGPVGQYLLYGIFPGALSALIFCNWTEYPFFNFMAIHSFVFHGWIVAYVIMQFINGDIKVTYKGIWKTALALAICAVPIFIFNTIFKQNYMFLNIPSEGSPLVPLWNAFGEKFGIAGYLTAYAVFVIVVFHVLWAIYTLIQKKFLEKGKTDSEQDNHRQRLSV